MKTRKQKPTYYITTGILILFASLLMFIPSIYKLADPDFKIELQNVKYGPSQENWTPLYRVSTLAINAILASEDNKFYEHHGVDMTAIWNSLQQNISEKSYASGASTISQQVVKMIFLGREKTLSRKFKEILGALLLEMLLSKDEILAWYVNIAPFGPGVYGISQASEYFFNTEAEFLNVIQSIDLAMVLPRPSLWSLDITSRHFSEASKRRFIRIANLMHSQRMITTDQRFLALKIGDFGRDVRQPKAK